MWLVNVFIYLGCVIGWSGRPTVSDVPSKKLKGQGNGFLYLSRRASLKMGGQERKSNFLSLQRFLFTLLSWRKCIIQMKILATSRLVHINTKRLINYLRLVFFNGDVLRPNVWMFYKGFSLAPLVNRCVGRQSNNGRTKTWTNLLRYKNHTHLKSENNCPFKYLGKHTWKVKWLSSKTEREKVLKTARLDRLQVQSVQLRKWICKSKL